MEIAEFSIVFFKDKLANLRIPLSPLVDRLRSDKAILACKGWNLGSCPQDGWQYQVHLTLKFDCGYGS